jgi:hypothetical protein
LVIYRTYIGLHLPNHERRTTQTTAAIDVANNILNIFLCFFLFDVDDPYEHFGLHHLSNHERQTTQTTAAIDVANNILNIFLCFFLFDVDDP